MPTPRLADLIDEYNEIKGHIGFRPDYKKLIDRNLERVVFCDKTIGKSHFSLIRNKDFEIIFTHRVGKKTHEARLDLNNFDSIGHMNLLLDWGPDYCELRWDYSNDCCIG